VVGLLAICLLLGCGGDSLGEVSQEEYDSVKADLAEAQAEVAKLQVDLGTERAKVEQLESDLTVYRVEGGAGSTELQILLEIERARVGELQGQLEIYESQVNELGRQLVEYQAQLATCQYKPTHTVGLNELKINPVYWNTDWDDDSLLWTTMVVNSRYFETHTYIVGQANYNDMVIDIWNMLQTEGITAIIVTGSHTILYESFRECDHAWILIYSSEGTSYALECTTSQVYTWEEAQNGSHLLQYWEGYMYAEPSDLRADLK